MVDVSLTIIWSGDRRGGGGWGWGWRFAGTMMDCKITHSHSKRSQVNVILFLSYLVSHQSTWHYTHPWTTHDLQTTWAVIGDKVGDREGRWKCWFWLEPTEQSDPYFGPRGYLWQHGVIDWQESKGANKQNAMAAAIEQKTRTSQL